MIKTFFYSHRLYFAIIIDRNTDHDKKHTLNKYYNLKKYEHSFLKTSKQLYFLLKV